MCKIVWAQLAIYQTSEITGFKRPGYSQYAVLGATPAPLHIREFAMEKDLFVQQMAFVHLKLNLIWHQKFIPH